MDRSWESRGGREGHQPDGAEGPRPTRRAVVGGLAAGLAGVRAALPAPALAQGGLPDGGLEKELVFASRGGSLGTVWRTKIIPGFERRFGCKVTTVTADSVPALARVVAERNAPQVDVIWTTDQTHAQGRREDVLAPLDAGLIPNARDCYDFAVLPDGVGLSWGIGGCAIGYNADLLRENSVTPPASWLDLFQPGLKGRVGWLDFSTAQGTSSFLMINRIKGGSEEEVEPGFRFLKDNLDQFRAIVSSPAQVDEVLQQRQAWAATNLDARFLLLKSRRFPVRVAYGAEGIPQIAVILDLVRGARHPRLAHAFIDHVLGPEMQEIVGRDMQIGPTNRRAVLPPEVADDLVYGPERVAKLVRFDYARVAEHLPDWIGRWNREMVR